MRIARLLVTGLLIARFVELYADNGDLSKLARIVKPSVFLLTIYDHNDKAIFTATGFILTKDGKIATNHHVIERAFRVEAKASNGAKYGVLGVISEDKKSDLVILKLDGIDFKPIALGTSRSIEVGQRLIVIGSPRGLEGTLSEGIVSALRDESEKTSRIIQMTAAISPGSSGSPVLNRSGKVIGIASAQIQNGQTLNFAVAVDALSELLRGAETAKGWKTFAEMAPQSAKIDAILSDPNYLSCNELIKANNTSELLKVTLILVQKYPESYLSHRLLGIAYQKLRFYSEAIIALQQSLKILPDSANTWSQLGVVYNELKRDEDAIFAF